MDKNIGPFLSIGLKSSETIGEHFVLNVRNHDEGGIFIVDGDDESNYGDVSVRISKKSAKALAETLNKMLKTKPTKTKKR